jgi:hypothetical protein
MIRTLRQRWFMTMTESVSESRPLSASESERPEPTAPEPVSDPAAGPARARRRNNWIDGICALALVGCAVAFLWARKKHELTYPVPWPDEGSFLWPAIAFRDRFSLFAPELFPEREVFWMPPGFMVLEGLIFKVWTFSLGRARLLSAIYLLVALGCVVAMLRKSRARIGHALILGVFLFSPIFQLAGNTARMECLVLLIASAGFFLMHAKRWAGLCVLAFAPLVHPVGLAFLFVGAAYWFVFVRRQRLFAHADRVVLGAVVLSWIAFAVHVVPNFQFFYDDIATQVKFKSWVSEANGGAVTRMGDPLMLVSSTAVAASIALAVRFGAPVGALIALAVASLFAFVLTEGWLYDIYPAFGAMLASLLLFETGTVFLSRPPRTNQLGTVVAIGLLGALIWLVDANWVVLNPYLMRSVRGSTATTWNHHPSYLSPREHDQVANFLRGLGEDGHQTTVQFLPDADALLFEDVRSPSVGFVQQTYYESAPDVFILHRSPWFPPYIYELELMGFVMRSGIVRPLEAWQEIARANSESRWIVVRKPHGKIDWR